MKVYRKIEKGIGAVRNFQRVPEKKSMFKVGAFFLELMNFQIETVRRISFPFGQRPKQTLLTYGNPSMLIQFHTFVVERERSPCKYIDFEVEFWFCVAYLFCVIVA